MQSNLDKLQFIALELLLEVTSLFIFSVVSLDRFLTSCVGFSVSSRHFLQFAVEYL